MYTFSTCNMRSNSSTDSFPIKIRAACIAVSELVYGILNTQRGKTWRWNGDDDITTENPSNKPRVSGSLFFGIIFSKRISEAHHRPLGWQLDFRSQTHQSASANSIFKSCLSFAKKRCKGAWLSWFQIKLCGATITLSTGTTSRLHDKHRRTFSIKRTQTLRPHCPCKWVLSAP